MTNSGAVFTNEDTTLLSEAMFKRTLNLGAVLVSLLSCEVEKELQAREIPMRLKTITKHERIHDPTWVLRWTDGRGLDVYVIRYEQPLEIVGTYKVMLIR